MVKYIDIDGNIVEVSREELKHVDWLVNIDGVLFKDKDAFIKEVESDAAAKIEAVKDSSPRKKKKEDPQEEPQEDPK